MNKAYLLNIECNDDGDKLSGKVDNVGYWIGNKTHWSQKTSDFVTLDIVKEPEDIEIQGKKLYRFPKLSLPRMKVDTLKEKYNVKVVRDPDKADYSIVSNKFLESLLDTSWYNYHTVDHLADFISVVEQYPKIAGQQFVDNIKSLYEKLNANDRICIKTGYYYGGTREYDKLRQQWDKVKREADNGLGNSSSVILENRNVSHWNNVRKHNLVLDKCLNKICNEDAHVITEDEVDTTMQMLRSSDSAAKAMALEMLANCNIEKCLDKVAYMYIFAWDNIRYADNWNTVNVKALRERMHNFDPRNTNPHQIHVYNDLVAELALEDSLTEWVWLKIRNDIHSKVLVSTGIGIPREEKSSKSYVFNIPLESIKLNHGFDTVVKKPVSGEEIIEELTKPDGFDDLPF